MKRILASLATLVVFATACGGSDATDVLVELGLSEAEAECFTREYEERGLDLDRVLRADEDELDDDEQTAVIEIATECAGGGTSDSGSGSSDGSSSDDTDDNSDGDDSGSTDDGGDGDDSSKAGARTYESLSILEQAFADGMMMEGASEEAAVCIINEFDAAGISLLEFMDFGPNDQPTNEMMSAIFKCGDELIEAGAFDFSDPDIVTPEGADTYGDDADLDALWDLCEFGDGAACDELYFISPVGSEYENFGNTCGYRFAPDEVYCADELGGTDTAMFYGDDPYLDGLWDSCAAGDMVACDDLYWGSPIDSDYEDYGSTCGGLESPTFGGCSTSEPMFYGEDDYFDGLYDSCGAGDMVACDDLFWQSPIDSEYEYFGSLCGFAATEEQFGGCETLFSS